MLEEEKSFNEYDNTSLSSYSNTPSNNLHIYETPQNKVHSTVNRFGTPIYGQNSSNFKSSKTLVGTVNSKTGTGSRLARDSL